MFPIFLAILKLYQRLFEYCFLYHNSRLNYSYIWPYSSQRSMQNVSKIIASVPSDHIDNFENERIKFRHMPKLLIQIIPTYLMCLASLISTCQNSSLNKGCDLMFIWFICTNLHALHQLLVDDGEKRLKVSYWFTYKA